MKETVKFDMAQTVAKLSELSPPDCCKHCVASTLPENPVVAMAYVPFQLDKTAYPPEQALQAGTLFKALNKPFCGRSLINE